jgi:hypothetical protein
MTPRSIFNYIYSYSYYILIFSILGILFMGYRKKPKETKLFLVIYFTLFLIYRLTTPTLKYRPWIIPQQVVEGPPIQLFYPNNPFGFVSRTVKNPNEKIPEIDIKLVY